MKQAPERRTVWLVATNLLTLTGLLITLSYYRVPQKAYRRLVVEGRIPLVTAEHVNNRYYQLGRDVHQLYNPAQIRTLVFGDSLLGNASMQELFERADIAGRAIYGDTTGGLRERFVDYKLYNLDSVIILIGTNDALNGVSDNQFQENYLEIIAQSQNLWPNARICLLSIPPLSSWATGAESKNQRIAKWNEFLASLADQDNFVTLLPLAEQLTDEQGYLRPEMTSDGVHLSAIALQRFEDLTASHLAP
jgi:lysophospholipase L1-like esterase